MSENLAHQMKRAVGRDGITGKKIVAFVLFSAIVLVFVFYGMQQASVGSLGGQVAQVNRAMISLADLKREEGRLEQMYRQMFQGAIDFSGAQRKLLTQEAVQNLINSELIAQASEREGLRATDQDVLEFIVKDFSIFQENGVFQRDRYYQFLESNRFAPADFERLIRRDIENRRLRLAFEWSGAPNKLEQKRAQNFQEVQLRLSYVQLNPQEQESQLKISDAEVQKALADANFRTRAEDEFKATKSQYDKPDQVRAQHILIKTIPGDSASEKAALEKITNLRAMAAKTDFGSLAEKNSEDPGSKGKKGDLGYFGRGQMVPEFEQTAFGMKVGEISEPIKSQFGYHLIKLTDKKAAESAQFETHQSSIARALLARDMINREKQRVEEVFQKGEEKEWMSRLGLTWKETGAFDLGVDSIPGLGSEAVLQALSDVIAEPSKPRIVRDGSQIFVVKLKDMKTAAKSDKKMNLETLSRVRGSQAFEGWVQGYRATSLVEINDEVLK